MEGEVADENSIVGCLICAEDRIPISVPSGQGQGDSVGVIYLLHKLLQIPLWECDKYLNQSPSKWYNVCPTCAQMVGQGRALVDQIERLQLQLQTLQATLQNQVVAVGGECGQMRNQLKDDIRRLSMGSTIIVNNDMASRCYGQNKAETVVQGSGYFGVSRGRGRPRKMIPDAVAVASMVDAMNMEILIDDDGIKAEGVVEDSDDPLELELLESVAGQGQIGVGDEPLNSGDDDDGDDTEWVPQGGKISILPNNGDDAGYHGMVGVKTSPGKLEVMTTSLRKREWQGKTKNVTKFKKRKRKRRRPDHSCCICNITHENAVALKEHWKKEHAELEKGQCPICKKVFRDSYTLKRHYLADNVHKNPETFNFVFSLAENGQE